MRGHTKLFFRLILLFAYGCAHIPEHEKARMSDQPGCTTNVEEALNSGSFTVGDWPNRDWWKQFNDPTLTQLIESALELSPTLKKAEERLKGASQIALQKKSVLFPEFSLDGDDNWQHLSKDGFFRAFAPTIPPVVNDLTLGLSFSYEFDFWGKNRDLYRAAMGKAAAAAAEKTQAELILTTSIAYTYAQLQFLLRKRHILGRIEQNTLTIEAVRIKRQQNALDTSLSQLQARRDVLDIQESVTAVDQQVQQDLHKLKALAGAGQDAELHVEYHPSTSLFVALPENLSLDLIARRPDLAAQRARVEAAAFEIDAAKTDFYPNVNLMGLVGFESVFGASLFRSKNYSGTVDPALHLPIFTAGRLRAQLREKTAVFNEAVYGYNELILQTAQEVADRLTDITLLQKRIQTLSLTLQVAERQAALTQQRLERGIDDQIMLLDALNAAWESELALAEIEYGRQAAAILLIRALGGGYRE